MRKQVYKRAISRRLLFLLGVSVLFHGLLLSQWPSSKPILEFDYQLQNLALNLEPIEIVGQQTPTQNKTSGKSNTKAVTPQQSLNDKPAVTKHIASAEQITHETTGNGKTSRVLSQDSQAKLIKPAMNRARVLQQIRHDLAQYFYYPPLARRKGMQGTVLLGFGISGQGAIRNIRVVKSSGYAILDLAAQDAMQRLDKLNWYAALMPGKDMDLELPVIFRLTEG